MQVVKMITRFKKVLRRKKFPIFTIVIELFVISLLLWSIYLKYHQSLSSFSFIDQNSIALNPDKNLLHFYEPKSGWPLIYSYKGIPGETGRATINSDGLNEPREYTLEKPDSVFRIITLGDSFTFGWFVNSGENYPEQLEYKLNNSNCSHKIEVINLGVGGYDIEYALHRFSVRGQKYDPDLILWLVQNNDFEEISDYVISNGKQRYNKLVNEGSTEKDLAYKDSGSPGWSDARKDLQKSFGIDNIVKYQAEKLQTINDLFQKKLVFITFTNTSPKYKDILKNFSLKRADTFLLDSIPELKTPEYAFPDYHPNPNGYKLISDQIYNYLILNRIIPCQTSNRT